MVFQSKIRVGQSALQGAVVADPKTGTVCGDQLVMKEGRAGPIVTIATVLAISGIAPWAGVLRKRPRGIAGLRIPGLSFAEVFGDEARDFMRIDFEKVRPMATAVALTSP
jgi:hypothetical protein